MLSDFEMNGIQWVAKYVSPTDSILKDRFGKYTVAVTDPVTHTIYLSSGLSGEFQKRVLLHELGHATMVSYGMLRYLEELIPNQLQRWELEEWACNLIADYGRKIFSKAELVLGEKAWNHTANEMSRFVA